MTRMKLKLKKQGKAVMNSVEREEQIWQVFCLTQESRILRTVLQRR
jgi:hypothetical protein